MGQPGVEVDFGLVERKHRALCVELDQREEGEVGELSFREVLGGEGLVGCAAKHELQLDVAAAGGGETEVADVVAEAQARASEHATPDLVAHVSELLEGVGKVEGVAIQLGRVLHHGRPSRSDPEVELALLPQRSRFEWDVDFDARERVDGSLEGRVRMPTEVREHQVVGAS